MQMILLVTGSRHITDPEVWKRAARYVLAQYPSVTEWEVVHGDCPTGVDRLADRAARAKGTKVTPFPADWDAHGKAAGPKRNQAMVDYCRGKPAVCLAIPCPKSRGTHDCKRRALEAEIPCITFVVES